VDARSLDDALALRPDLAAPLDDLMRTLRSGPIEPELLDACEGLIRHRVGVPVRGAVPDVGAAALDDRSRAVLVMAEQFVVDPHGIDPPMRDAVLDHCSLAELATLVQAFAMFDALARMEAVLISSEPQDPGGVTT
jgi:alkylhydroperoxidase family enzyme